jgi:hypothetical protein
MARCLVGITTTFVELGGFTLQEAGIWENNRPGETDENGSRYVLGAGYELTRGASGGLSR